MPKVNARYVDTPSIGLDEVPLKKNTQRGRCEPSDYSSGGSALVMCCRDIPEAFTESLILAQDERWR
ncbi:hypothetical protein, partial [Streptomyces malaysiensis]|uniref:hypothetical protein n=1 Tax=Streptomyces malaysiensis TaxID=92644 RepID=UPI0031FCBFFC